MKPVACLIARLFLAQTECSGSCCACKRNCFPYNQVKEYSLSVLFLINMHVPIIYKKVNILITAVVFFLRKPETF